VTHEELFTRTLLQSLRAAIAESARGISPRAAHSIGLQDVFKPVAFRGRFAAHRVGRVVFDRESASRRSRCNSSFEILRPVRPWLKVPTDTPPTTIARALLPLWFVESCRNYPPRNLMN